MLRYVLSWWKNESIQLKTKLMCIEIRNLNKKFNFLLILLRFIDIIRAPILGGYLYKYVLPEILKYWKY